MSRDERSCLMARISQRNTAPELALRRGLHRLGLRFRVNVNGLPGRPDLVFPKYRVALFVHGCFWHAHTCRAGRAPSSNVAYWSEKLRANTRRDRLRVAALRRLGWRVWTVWECGLKRPADAERTLLRLRRRFMRVGID
ncbi:MAG: very short patch repair endonuclease [Burkholderiaceae bacterium]